MRIIAGKRGHLKLIAPEGEGTRPTTDRIKETLFNILNYDLPGTIFLDLFAGSGQIGIEALSRGAKHAYFVEKDRKAASIIRQNIFTSQLTEESTVLEQNVFDALRGFPKGTRFDFIFMDPPYKMQMEGEILKLISENDLADKNTIIIIEADLKRDLSFIENSDFEITRQKKYKNNQHIFLKRR
jgi:16S rRNA (guanine966-N2)-methyltransferase